MGVFYCANCEGKVSDSLHICPHCGHPVSPDPVFTATQTRTHNYPETHVMTLRPSMWRNDPIRFILLWLLMIICVPVSLVMFSRGPHELALLSWVLLLFWPALYVWWWLVCLNTRLEITTSRSILRKGILSKSTSEISHSDVRYINCKQSFFQRLLKVGKVGISSAAQSNIELEISGIKAPQEVAAKIRELRKG